MAIFVHFSLERPFSMAAMIVLTLKGPSLVDLSNLKCSDKFQMNEITQINEVIQNCKMIQMSQANWMNQDPQHK